MSIKAVGQPPPEADQLKAEIEAKLPDIIKSFTQVLHDQYGFEGVQVGGFTVVPLQTADNKISCDDQHCSVG